MSKRLMYLTVGVAALLLAPAAWAVHDVTSPADIVQGVPNDGVSTDNSTNGWPGNESPPQAIDDQITTKFLHFRGEVSPTGIRVTPKAGATVVTGITLTTANDAPERDPVSYELSGANDSIDGPYTLIAKGPIVDFVGGVWPRRTINATPIKFANTIAYKHYQLLFPTVSNPATANSMQIAEIELLADNLKAYAPNPASGGVVTMPLFQWTKGDTTMFHDIYFGTSQNLTAADLKTSHQPGAMTVFYYTGVMQPGVTYYWRVDEIDAAGQVYTGDVWSVMVAPKSAYNPTPLDGNKWLPVTQQLSWTPGANAVQHDVYFSTDKQAVTNRSASASKGSSSALTFNPGTLAQNTTYYWAVDETAFDGAKYPGAVWSFTTIGTGGGARGDYFAYTYAAGTTFTGTPLLSRIDSSINVNLLGTASPGGSVPGDGWGARWTADLEIAVADTYQFSLNCQDGTRMWIDGQLIIDRWVVPTVTSEYFALPMHLDRGIHSLKVEFFDSGGDAVEQLYWSTATMAKVLVPAGPLQPPTRAFAISPADKATAVPQNVTLLWGAGGKAVKHDVYFGTDANAVAAATTATTDIYQGQQALDQMSFTPSTLDWGTTYYWRIDEVNDAASDSPWQSSVWSFTTADFLVVDDMESYNDTDNRIYDTWIDGLTDGKSNSQVGYDVSPFAEHTIVNGGKQSMPMSFDNSTTPFYSEAVQTFSSPQDWTINGVKNLSVWARGYPAPTPVTVTETSGKMTLTGDGTDIWNNSDDFTFAYKTLTGDGSMVARVVSIGAGTNTWAKGGVMIRNTINGGSTFVDMVLTANSDGAAGNGASFQYRLAANGGCGNTDSTVVIKPPYWVKIQRAGDSITGYVSANGTTWTQMGSTQIIKMTGSVCIGVCVTAHQAGEQRTFQFDSIATTGGVSGSWLGAQIASPQYNGTANLYVTVEDSSGKSATATNATLVNAGAWTNWSIPLSSFTGVSLTKVKKLYIGVGDKKNPVPDGSGRIYIDDICVTK